uniref:Uncharacterized protein n=1 Tax=Aegilops tauschii subsp. strangulata TaxID=200361 RepID=A0A453PCJ0_AEGTS
MCPERRAERLSVSALLLLLCNYLVGIRITNRKSVVQKLKSFPLFRVKRILF